VAAGSVDLAVVGEPPADVDLAGVAFERILDDRLLVAVNRGHRLATELRVAPDDLADEQWIVGSSDPSEGLLGAWHHGSWRPREAFTAREWIAKLGLVAAGLGVTIVPTLSAAAIRKDIALIPIADPRARRAVGVITSASGELAEPIGAFRTALEQAALALGGTASHRDDWRDLA
jgi:DNA-binding transcriptional LysR family regulator